MIRRKLMLAAVGTGTVLALSLAAPANAAGPGTGQTLGVGDSRCTDRVQSDNGARATAFLNGGTGEWTVRRASTPGGAETVVFRAAATSLRNVNNLDQTIPPSTSGAALYRLCLSVNRVLRPIFFSIAYYQMSITSTSPNAVTDIGPETATLSQSAQACGDRTAVPDHNIRLVGTSTGRTQWIIAVTGNTNNFEGNWAVLLTDGTNIDQTLTLDPEITHVTACAGGFQPSGKISVAFELSTS
jgi:hypothetical protein